MPCCTPMQPDEHYMRLALAEAEEAARVKDVPVGAIVVDQDPTAHAEIVALRQAAARLGTWRLHDATLFATLEPCPMCAGALVNARISRVVYGCDDPKAGALRSLFSLGQDARL